VIVVVASRHDPSARDIVAGWADDGAALLGCEDMSTAGWRHLLPGGRSQGAAVVGGRVVPERDIRGVLVRRSWVFEGELGHIAADDREYVASEMSAFLQSWLAHLECPVLNRPCGLSLCGPAWRPQQWARAARRAGLPAADVRRAPGPAGFDLTVDLTVVGERCFGAASRAHAAAAVRLASLAGTGLLGVRLRGGPEPAFVAATATPSLEEPEVARAVRAHLRAS
jgi:hypothetical protein